MKLSISDDVSIVESKYCENVLLLKISDTLLGKDVIVGCIYVHTEGSDYADKNVYYKLSQELLFLGNSDVLICGDYNARTGNLCEFVSYDEAIKNDLDIANQILDITQSEMSLEEIGFTHERFNMDVKINNHGRELISMCKDLGLFIVNGRMGSDKGVGRLTCKNRSTVDYCIVSSGIVPNICNFEVDDFCESLSDVHCPVGISLKSNAIGNAGNTASRDQGDSRQSTPKQYVHRACWNNSKRGDFIDMLDNDRINALNEDILQLHALEGLNVSQGDVNNVYSELCNIILDSGFSSDTVKTSKVRISSSKKDARVKKEWFNEDCHKLRKEFHVSKQKDKILNSDLSRSDRQRASKKYKKIVNKCKSEHKRNFVESLRRLKSSDAKAYWKILNGKKCNDTNDIDIEDFYKHFETLLTSNNIDDANFDVNSLTITENVQLNRLFTEKEVLVCINKLKNNKAPGCDIVINEFIKASSGKMLTCYTNLFNLVLCTGIVPVDWAVGEIVPLFKKGDKNKPGNYRGITLLSCLGKVFTSCINERLACYVEEEGILNEEQAGFRPGYCTADHIFTLHTLLDMYLNKRKRLYCAFIDFKKAFDTVDRVLLWKKLASVGINGRLLNVVHNIYKLAKSYVRNNGKISNTFLCNIGVRQGENLSPLLFAMYLNDLSQFLSNKVKGLVDLSQDIKDLASDDDVEVFLKLYLLLYADDIVILCESKDDLQLALNELHSYCMDWKLYVSTEKTKIMVFSRGKIRNRPVFTYNNNVIEIVDNFTYLGVTFNYNNRFSKAAKRLYDQAAKAMYSLLKKSRKLGLPVDVQIELFDSLVAPIILYNSEIWGMQNLNIVNKLQIKYYKLVLGANISTPSVMVLGDLGKCPLELNVKQRILMYWFKLVTCNNGCKLSFLLYQLAVEKDKSNIFCTSWLQGVKDILYDIGLPEVWLSQSNLPYSKDVFKSMIKRRLLDKYIQKWYSDVETSDICCTYRIFKQEFRYEPYLDLNYTTGKQLFRFRAANNYLPVNRLRYSGVERHNRKCVLCTANELGDEFHYLFVCNFFSTERSCFIKKYYYQHPNVIKFKELFTCTTNKVVTDLVRFINTVNSVLHT